MITQTSLIRRGDLGRDTYGVVWMHEYGNVGDWRYKFVPVRVGMSREGANLLLQHYRRRGLDVLPGK